MSNVARLRIDKAAEGAAMYLGPAEVVSADVPEIEARLPRGELVRARVAVAYAYDPRPGDQVLLIGNADGHWVIGVLSASGPAILSFPGDAEVRAAGVLTLSADKGVAVAAPQVEVQTSKLRAVASEVVSTFQSLRQRVSELLSVHAGSSHTIVDGPMHTQAKSAAILTEEKVSINGKSVHLG
jgi:hypothetical protein